MIKRYERPQTVREATDHLRSVVTKPLNRLRILIANPIIGKEIFCAFRDYYKTVGERDAWLYSLKKEYEEKNDK